MDKIKKAINNNYIIKFNYVSGDLAISFNRIVEPLEIINNNYLIGKDLNKGFLRKFLIEGIKDCIFIATNIKNLINKI